MLKHTQYPLLETWLNGLPEKKADIVVVLYEDGWETSFGDGTERIFVAVFRKEGDADCYIRANTAGWTDKHFKRAAVLELREGLVCLNLELGFREYCTTSDVLGRLEAQFNYS